MKILLLNPNTSESMTAEIAAAARAVAAEGTEIVTRNPRFGTTAIDSSAESYLSAVGVFAPGPDNPRSHWPLSTSMGLDP
jgi:allantoin racemase